MLSKSIKLYFRYFVRKFVNDIFFTPLTYLEQGKWETVVFIRNTNRLIANITSVALECHWERRLFWGEPVHAERRWARGGRCGSGLFCHHQPGNTKKPSKLTYACVVSSTTNSITIFLFRLCLFECGKFVLQKKWIKHARISNQCIRDCHAN